MKTLKELSSNEIIASYQDKSSKEYTGVYLYTHSRCTPEDTILYQCYIWDDDENQNIFLGIFDEVCNIKEDNNTLVHVHIY